MRNAIVVVCQLSAVCLAFGQTEVFYGDADGFGFGAPEVDGEAWRALGGAFFADYREPDDLANAPTTDLWDAFPRIATGRPDQIWTFVYESSGLSAANLHIYGAGYGDFTGPAEIFVDGVFLAALDFPGQFETTHIIDLDVPTDLLDGDTEIEFRTPEGDGYIIDYARLDLSGGCRADIDGDGELTIFDFLAYQNAFDAGDPIADFDGDGDLTIFDFLAFQNEFDAGCE